jgi:hypothetical protein
MTQVQQVFNYAVLATADVAFTAAQVPHGIAKGLLVTTTITSGITLTLSNGSTTVALGNHTVGQYIPIRCTKVSFGAAGAVAMLG